LRGTGHTAGANGTAAFTGPESRAAGDGGGGGGVGV